MQTEGPPVHFINIEYFFQLLYNLFFATGTPNLSASHLFVVFSTIWLVVTVLAYLFSLATIGVLAYSTVRLYQIRKDEEPLFATRSEAEEHVEVEHSRWKYIMELIETGQQSDWRQAIIEADIMLDDMLNRLGYHGDSIGEKLKAVNPNMFHTLNNAWEAHKVRNEIAHQGSAYELSEHIAHRTIANYKVVFLEQGEI